MIGYGDSFLRNRVFLAKAPKLTPEEKLRFVGREPDNGAYFARQLDRRQTDRGSGNGAGAGRRHSLGDSRNLQGGSRKFRHQVRLGHIERRDRRSRGEIAKVDAKIDTVKSELKSEISEFRSEFKDELTGLRAEISWMPLRVCWWMLLTLATAAGLLLTAQQLWNSGLALLLFG